MRMLSEEPPARFQVARGEVQTTAAGVVRLVGGDSCAVSKRALIPSRSLLPQKPDKPDKSHLTR